MGKFRHLSPPFYFRFILRVPTLLPLHAREALLSHTRIRVLTALSSVSCRARNQNMLDPLPAQQLHKFLCGRPVFFFLILVQYRIKRSAFQILLLSLFRCDQPCQIFFRDMVFHRTAKQFRRPFCPKAALAKRLSQCRKTCHTNHKI